MLSRGRRWVEKTSEKKRSPSVEDLLPGQVVLKCVRINFIYWPQNPNRRPSAPCSGLTVSAGVSCSWALGLAYWIFIYSLPLCLWHLTESWVLNLGLGVSYFYYGKFFLSFFQRLRATDTWCPYICFTTWSRTFNYAPRPAIVLGLRRRSVNSQDLWQWTRAKKCCKPAEITGKTVSMAGINQSNE